MFHIETWKTSSNITRLEIHETTLKDKSGVGGPGNSVGYKNKQKRHFHTKVIRVFMEGEKVPDGIAREEDRER